MHGGIFPFFCFLLLTLFGWLAVDLRPLTFSPFSLRNATPMHNQAGSSLITRYLPNVPSSAAQLAREQACRWKVLPTSSPLHPWFALHGASTIASMSSPFRARKAGSPPSYLLVAHPFAHADTQARMHHLGRRAGSDGVRLGSAFFSARCREGGCEPPGRSYLRRRRRRRRMGREVSSLSPFSYSLSHSPTSGTYTPPARPPHHFPSCKTSPVPLRRRHCSR